MDAVTYPDSEVIEFIEEYLVPLRVRYDSKPLSEDFNVKWTPTLVLLDSEGKEHNRTVGFLDPKDLVASLVMGFGKIYFDFEKYSEAASEFDKFLVKYPKSEMAPEAIYMRGVGGYKSQDNPQLLKQAYEMLADKYPGNEWTRRAYPYRLL